MNNSIRRIIDCPNVGDTVEHRGKQRTVTGIAYFVHKWRVWVEYDPATESRETDGYFEIPISRDSDAIRHDSDTTRRQKEQVWAEIQTAYTTLLTVSNESMYLDNLKRARNALRKCVTDRYDR